MILKKLNIIGYDYKTDVWSTGCILFELITLEQPFKGNSLIELAESIFANKIPDFSAPKHLKLLVKM
jgi:serine/threonine protein kinase